MKDRCLGCNKEADMHLNVFTIYDHDVRFYFGFEDWHLCYKCFYHLVRKALIKCVTCGQGYMVQRSLILNKLNTDVLNSIVFSDTICVRFISSCPNCKED